MRAGIRWVGRQDGFVRCVMAKLEQTLYGNFNTILNKIESGIVNGSMSASLEESSDFRSGEARCSVRVFERYSWAGTIVSASV